MASDHGMGRPYWSKGRLLCYAYYGPGKNDRTLMRLKGGTWVRHGR